ncbi:carbamoyltransferase C-terminal domain-containing protein [Actinoplanes sp. NPDC049265]|uniref:carbamoyltransferase C-terminal domain-containing protein n=1 Tax=Actinoplanes sp. NPDC049265 TaxID=3363902 RepID=UPI00371C9872
MSLIIGYNLSHDSSICLVDDGRVRAASALERSSRIKRGIVPLHAYAAAMAALTHEVLGGEGLAPEDIDYWIATSTESRDEQDEAHLADALGLLVPNGRRLTLPHPGHHLAHASAAFYTSGFDEAAALVIDAYGSRVGAGRERESGFLFRHGQVPEQVLRTERTSDRVAGWPRAAGGIGLPRDLSGVGELYRVVTLALGFSDDGTYDDAGKTMGLAPYGRRMSEDNLFIDVTPDGLSFDQAADSLIDLGLAVPDGDGLRLTPRRRGAPLEDIHRDLAAQIQAEFEEACLSLVDQLVSTTRVRTLVLGGGCFLNSVFNARLLAEGLVERVYVFPAATDDGNAVGAALYAHHVLTGPPPARPSPRLTHVYLGPPRLTGRDPESIAHDWGLTTVRHDSLRSAAAAAARSIADGQIVAWFGDRGELGPRALGARSILCHPGIPGMKDTLNRRVKFRETFRPFAGAVLAEQAAKWFDMIETDSPFMLMVWPVGEHVREQIGEIVHVDGTCRVQTVPPELPGAFRPVIEEFEALTGIPVVLNTSFNLRGMPIVERIEEALDCLYGSRLDRLFLDDLEIDGVDHAQLRPIVTSEGAGGVSPHGDDERALRTLGDGSRSVEEIAAEAGRDPRQLVDVALDLRRLGQLTWAGVPSARPPRYPLPQYDAGNNARAAQDVLRAVQRRWAGARGATGGA